MSLHDTGDLTCPRCGDSLADAVDGEVSASVEEQIRVATDCPQCGAAIEIVVESAMPDALGLDVWVEDRRGRRLTNTRTGNGVGVG